MKLSDIRKTPEYRAEHARLKRKINSSRQPKFEVYQDKRGEWRWRFRARNGRILFQGESHSRNSDAKRAANTAYATVYGMAVAELHAAGVIKT